jgi:hypothetical protein
VKFLEVLLLFVTLWVVVICGFMYLSRRSAAAWAARSHRPTGTSGQCCREVPCSDECARGHQEVRDLLTVRYGEVVRELGHIIEAGQDAPVRQLEAASGYAWSPDE